ncbi:MAG: hypothetical protein R3B95_19655 [Nitrospirales bacterium]|nr:hypothetical protein [Nitrospirales bacterium]
MKSQRVLVSVTPKLKGYLDELREDGFTAAAYIRGLLEDDCRAWRDYERAHPEEVAQARRKWRKKKRA